MSRTPRIRLAAAVAASALLLASGCNLLQDFDGARGIAPVGTVTSGDHINSVHVGIAVASDADYLPEPGVELVLSGADPYHVIAVPVSPPGRLNDDGDPLTAAERVDVAGALAFDIPVSIEDDNRFGASLAFADDLLLVGAPGLDATRNGRVRAFAAREANNDIPFASVSPPGGGRGNFGISVAAGDITGDGIPDAIAGDLGKAWFFEASAANSNFLDGIELGDGGEFGSGVAAGPFETNPAGLAIAQHIAVSDPDAGTVDTFYIDSTTMMIAAGVSYGGLTAASALAFLDNGGPMIVAGAAESGSSGEVFLLDPAGGTTTLPLPVEAGVTFAELGAAVAVGDLNNDGADDIIAGAPGSTVDGVAMAGAAVVWFGNGAGSVLSGAADIIVLRRVLPEEDDRFGTAVGAAGDEGGPGLDSDRCGEVLVGAPATGDLFRHGLVLVYFDLLGGGAMLPGAATVGCN